MQVTVREGSLSQDGQEGCVLGAEKREIFFLLEIDIKGGNGRETKVSV